MSRKKPITDPNREMLNVIETAEVLGWCRATVYYAMRRGDIPSIRVGRRWLVPRQKLLNLMQGRLRQKTYDTGKPTTQADVDAEIERLLKRVAELREQALEEENERAREKRARNAA